MDPTGRLWVSEFDNNRVVWFSNAFALVTNKPNADGVLGQDNFVTNTSGSSQNRMSNPIGITVSSEGALFVADPNNNRVMIFKASATLRYPLFQPLVLKK